MKKVRLDMDALRVESFATSETEHGRGTVQGHETYQLACHTRYPCATDDNTCHAEHTCGGYNTCDEGCNNTQGPANTCYQTCYGMFTCAGGTAYQETCQITCGTATQ